MAVNASYARYENNPARQLAYQLWSLDTSKPIVELMPALEEALGEKVALRTVQDWRHRDQWEVRYAEEAAARSGVLVVEHVTRLRVAAPELVSYLHKVANGEEKYDHNRVQTARYLVSEAGRFLSLVPALNVALPPPSLPSLDAMSDEELRAYGEQVQRG